MARKIAIELEVNGVKESITTINELENSIEQLTEELKNTEIGSERFNQLTNDLSKANSQLKTLETQFEGLDPQQQTQAYLAFGESVVSGVLLAQEALRAFGVENESVNKAVEASTQAINIALQARIVIEGVMEARIIATTIAQRALNTSIVASNRVLKILFATMAANPIGAILAVVGLLVAAFIALSDSTEEAKTAQEEYNDINLESQKQTAKTIAQLNFYAKVVNDVTRSEDERRLALEELNKAGIRTDDITLDNIDSLDKLNERLELARENILLKAQAEAVSTLLAEAMKNEIEAQNSELEDNISWWEKGLIALTSFGNGFIMQARRTQTAAENQAENINSAQEEVNKILDIYLKIQEQLLDNQVKINKEVGEDTKDAFDEYTKTIGRLNREIQNLGRSFQDFGNIDLPPAVARLEEARQALEDIRKESEKRTGAPGQFILDLTDNITEGLQQGDKFGQLIDDLRENLSEGLISVFDEEGGSQEAIDNYFKTIEGLFAEGSDIDFSEFSQEQQRVFIELTSGYRTLTRQFQSLSDEFGDETISITEFLDNVGDRLKLEGSVSFAEVNEENINELETQLQQKLFIGQVVELPIAPDLAFAEEQFENYVKNVEEVFIKRRIEEATAAKGSALTKEQVKETQELAREEARTLIETLTDTTTRIVEQEDTIRGFYKQVQEGQVESFQTILDFYGLSQSQFDEFISDNRERLSEAFGIDIDEGATLEDIKTLLNVGEDEFNSFIARIIEATGGAVEFEQQLLKLAKNPTVRSGIITEQLLNNIDSFISETELSLETFADGQQDALISVQQAITEFFGQSLDELGFTAEQIQKIYDEVFKNLKENSEDVGETISSNIEGNIQEVLNSLSQLTLSLGEASQLQIERVERNTQQVLDTIVGNTEEAEQLRTEIQEQSSKEIVEIERRARLRELQFTKIQATADLAQALINALKLPPPFNAIQAGIIGTSGSIQIATIQGQIDDLQSAQGFATGGYVEGPGTSTSDSIPAMLSNGEFVVNARATERFLPLLESINNNENEFQRFSNGGFVVESAVNPNYNTSTNIQNIFDDSRIIDELRKTRQEPLRAYVFEKDITDAQQIEKRLQELSKL